MQPWLQGPAGGVFDPLSSTSTSLISHLGSSLAVLQHPCAGARDAQEHHLLAGAVALDVLVCPCRVRGADVHFPKSYKGLILPGHPVVQPLVKAVQVYEVQVTVRVTTEEGCLCRACIPTPLLLSAKPSSFTQGQCVRPGAGQVGKT